MAEARTRIHGYELLQPLQNRDAGFSRWTFVRRNRQEFFLKEFMDPVYPTDPNLSMNLRAGRIAECEAFERKRTRLYSAVNAASDGNAVRIFDFFHQGSRYYIVTPRVVRAQITFERIAQLPLSQRALLCRSLAHTVMRLHSRRIVHSDIKETNVMLSPARNGNLTAKLIDFDAGFFEDDPPECEDDLGGDQVYLSPEACRFLCGEEVALTCAMDVFSLGLLFHQYLTGALPGFDTEQYYYAHEAVLCGETLTLSDTLEPPLRDMLARMLDVDPDKRCTAREAYRTLGDYIDPDPCRTGTVPPGALDILDDDAVIVAQPPAAAVRKTRLKGSNLLTDDAPDAAVSAALSGSHFNSAQAPAAPARKPDPAAWFHAGGEL